MARDDEKHLHLSSSSEKYFSDPEGEKARLKKEMQKKEQKHERQKLQRKVLRQNVKDPSKTFGTKTLEQEVKRAKDTTQKKADPDTLLKEGEQQEAAEDQAKIQEQTNQAS